MIDKPRRIVGEGTALLAATASNAPETGRIENRKQLQKARARSTAIAGRQRRAMSSHSRLRFEVMDMRFQMLPRPFQQCE
ncbi:hypothetical protein [Rhizobium sp. BK176]|uniref:hypothetical protein n=1 Tax=Rhizobium sp. BK176 TaxID=2587071 RepID=UPI0021687DA1|nr:hypothetical protein [Rhizobium sp. BK176]MCS4088663.1 hypothetical protein [Rhizobium sp. BK176]